MSNIMINDQVTFLDLFAKDEGWREDVGDGHVVGGECAGLV